MGFMVLEKTSFIVVSWTSKPTKIPSLINGPPKDLKHQIQKNVKNFNKDQLGIVLEYHCLHYSKSLFYGITKRVSYMGLYGISIGA